MKINKIKKLPSGKYKISFDNAEKLITYDDVILKNKVLFDKEIGEEKYQAINIDTKYYDIYNKVINLISKRIRSKKEIEEYLIKVPIEESDKLEIINKLQSIGLINDLNFTKAFISDKIHLSNYGPYKIKEELLKHNIDEFVIDNEISKIDIEEINNKLKKIIEKKVKNNTKYSDYILKQKILFELSNLGFDKEEIIKIYDNFDIKNNLLVEKEFDKMYPKLSKKYSGNELKYKMKEKLYQKGFDIDSINSVIEKIRV